MLFLLSRCCLIFFSCSLLNVAYAYPEPTKSDPLQVYRDEIKQSETNASQAVLDALKANADPDSTSAQQNQSVPETPAVSATPNPRSNTDKAFSTSPTNKPENSANKNPWLQPNPWAKQPPNIWEKNAKVNPYSNAPIPGPTPPSNASSHLAIPSPPNIFAPSRPTPNPNKPQANANF